MTTIKTRILTAAILVTSIVSVMGASVAQAVTGSPFLVSRTIETFQSGNTRVVDCSIWTDGVVIAREFAGITTTREIAFKVSGNIDAKMDDVAATAPRIKKSTPFNYTYSMTAYRTTATGAREALVLSAVDGTTGEEISNESHGSQALRGIIVDACEK